MKTSLNIYITGFVDKLFSTPSHHRVFLYDLPGWSRRDRHNSWVFLASASKPTVLVPQDIFSKPSLLTVNTSCALLSQVQGQACGNMFPKVWFGVHPKTVIPQASPRSCCVWNYYDNYWLGLDYLLIRDSKQVHICFRRGNILVSFSILCNTCFEENMALLIFLKCLFCRNVYTEKQE